MTTARYRRDLDLVASGPLIEARFLLPDAERELVEAAGRRAPEVQAEVLIDTGATLSLVDEDIPAALSLQPTRFMFVHGVNGLARCPVYLLTVEFPSTDSDAVMFWEVPFAALPFQPGHSGILGRDFLSRFSFHYDGPRNAFELVVEY